MKYRLALSLGLGWLGWAAIRLDAQGRPMAVIRAGVRVFASVRGCGARFRSGRGHGVWTV